jgi:hypothetical protein
MLEWILYWYLPVQCDGKILFKEPGLLSLTKFKLLVQTEGRLINKCEVLKIVISVTEEGSLRLLAPGAEKKTTSLFSLLNIT